MSKKDVAEEFLIDKYGVDVLKYEAFKTIRDILCKHDDYITKNIMDILEESAIKYKTSIHAVERNLRYIRHVFYNDKGTNMSFINNLIFEFKKYRKEHIDEQS